MKRRSLYISGTPLVKRRLNKQQQKKKNQNVVFNKYELTFHVHVGRLVQEMHKELRGVDEDLVSAVSDGAIPPRSL